MRDPWDASRAAAIAAGGVAGATIRWSVVTSVDMRGFPWPVLIINAAGSILLGVLLAEEWNHPRARLLLHDFGGIGFCGGLTTFSTFAVEVVDLIRRSDQWTAVAYSAVSVLSAIAGVVLGAAMLRRVRAITLPLEKEP